MRPFDALIVLAYIILYPRCATKYVLFYLAVKVEYFAIMRPNDALIVLAYIILYLRCGTKYVLFKLLVIVEYL